MTKTKIAKNYTFAVGRRKSATARVRLFKGDGLNLINGKKLDDVFDTKVALVILEKPSEVTETQGKFYFSAKVVGGGKEGQIEAIVHGVARALVKLNSDKFKVSLKKNNLLTRDSRERQRRMVGTGGKSRRKKQSPKR